MNASIRNYLRALQRRSAAKRWGGLTAAQRSAAMKKVRAAGLKTKATK